MTGVQTCALPILQVYGQWQQLFSQPLQQIAVQSLLAVPLAVLGIGGIRHLCSQSQDHRWVPWLLLGAALVPLLIMLAVTYTVRPVLLARTLAPVQVPWAIRSEEHTSELQSLMRISYAVFCL